MPPFNFCLAGASLLLAATSLSVFAAPPASGALAARSAAMFQSSEAVGMVIVIVTPAGVVIHGYGQDAPGSGKAPGPQSLVRIASTSKLLAADVALRLAAEGKLKLDDPLQRYAPPGMVVPALAGARPITLRDLATHTSGLPREPDLPYPEGVAPYAWPTAQVRWEWLARLKHTGAPGAGALYSNVGFDLLGDALAKAAGKPYAALLREKTTAPLAMDDTTSSPTSAQCARLMQGPESARCADTSATAATGGVYSTPADMGAWMAYMLGLNRAHQPDPQALKVVVPAAALGSISGLDKGGPVHGIGLGWIHLAPTASAPAIMQKTGGGLGFMSYMALAPSARVGVFAVMTRLDQAAMTTMVRQVTALTGELAAQEK
jgi:D-alanyl-D-alanine-carboxypeptidase/D-alanyl-D-alanine-endopeptidase